MVIGIDEIVKGLHGLGYAQYIVTSNTSDIAGFIKRFGLESCFQDILCGNRERSKVKKFDMIKQLHLENENDFIFITDTTGDIEEAKEFGLSHIYPVTRGYHGEILFEGIEGITILNNISDFYNVFPELKAA